MAHLQLRDSNPDDVFPMQYNNYTPATKLGGGI